MAPPRIGDLRVSVEPRQVKPTSSRGFEERIRRVLNQLGYIGRIVQTGAFLNKMWGGPGTALGNAQMFLIRLLMIWPLKVVTPMAYLYIVLQLGRHIRGRHSEIVSYRPHGLVGALKEITLWSLGKALRFWLVLEALFFLYYKYKHWQLEKRHPRTPVLDPGVPKEILGRVLESVKMIQRGGMLVEPQKALTLRKVQSYQFSSSPSGFQFGETTSTPKSDPYERQIGFGRVKSFESGVEDLLRDWEAAVTSTRKVLSPLPDDHLVPTALVDADDGAMEALIDDAQMLALKRAEVAGWFLLLPDRCERLPVSRVNELRRGNIQEWVAWAFFNCEPEQIPPSRIEETEKLIDEIIEWVEIDVKPGRNPAVVAMRLTMDSIPSSHRPLLYYAVTQTTFSTIIDLQMHGLGFRQHRSGTLLYWYRPGGPFPVGVNPGNPKHLDAPDSSGIRTPIVFCHGIGINVMPYRPLFVEMLEVSGGRPFFAISLPHISMRIKEDVPSSAEMVACLCDMLASWGFSSAHFVGHSFGSLPLAWMAKRAPGLVETMTFIDPVCFLLIKPDVCFNFMYRKPKSPTQLLLDYFVAQELYIAHSLSRNFFWQQNLLWPDELPGPTLVVLSGEDSIVPAHSVRRYLSCYKEKCKVETLRVMWFPDLGHGELNFGPIGLRACARIVQEMLQLERQHHAPASTSCSGS